MGEVKGAALAALVAVLALGAAPAAAQERLVSRAGLDGPQANGSSSDVALSDDARYAVFVTSATNLTSDDTTDDLDVVRKDLTTGEVRLVSSGDLVAQAPFGFGIGRPSVSADGRHVAFLAREGGAGPAQAFVRDMAAAGPERMTPAPADQPVYVVSLSADGRRAVFATGADNVSLDVDGDLVNVFGWSRDGVFGVGAPSPSGCGQTPNPSISPDGGWVVTEGTVTGTCDDAIVRARFERGAAWTAVEGSTQDLNGLLPLAGAGAEAVGWAADTADGIVVRRNGALLGKLAGPDRIGLSHDGGKVAWATNDVPPAVGTGPDVVVRDTVSGQTLLVSESTGNGIRPAVSGDGASVAFQSGGQVWERKLFARPPRNRTAPTVSGPDSFGVLTCVPGDWSASPTSYRYQWLRAGADIPGATEPTYTPAVADLEQPLSCRVTAVNGDGSASAVSASVVLQPAQLGSCDPVAGCETGPPPPSAADPPPKPTCNDHTFKKGVVDLRASCFVRKGALFETTLEGQAFLRLNGLDARVADTTAGAKVTVTIDPLTLRITSNGPVAWHIGPFRFSAGRIDLQLGQALPRLELPTVPGLSIGGLPVAGDLKVGLIDGGLRATLHVGLPPELGGISADAAAIATTETGARLESLKIEAKDLLLGPVLVNEASIQYRYHKDGAVWSGAAKVTMPSGPIISGAIVFAGGRFRSLNAEAAGLNVPVAREAVFLQRVRATVGYRPSFFGGGIGLSLGPSVTGYEASGIDGDFKVQFSPPQALEVSGALNIASIKLLGARVRVVTNGSVTVGGQLGFPLDLDPDPKKRATMYGFRADGTVEGYVDGRRSFEVRGAARITTPVPGDPVGGEALVSTKGVAGCVTLKDPVFGQTVRSGFGQSWGGAVEVMAATCSLGPWEVPRLDGARPAQAGGRSFVLPAGLDGTAVELVGRDGMPAGVLTGPGGVRVDVPAASQGTRPGRTWVVRIPELRLTAITVAGPRAGTWRWTPAAGSPPLERLRVARALPSADVRATVARRGARRVLRWRFAGAPGRQVRFVERAGDDVRVLATVRRARGTLAFAPVESRAATRRVVAEVIDRGTVREATTVARFSARTAGPSTPRRLRAMRKGSVVTLTWRPSPGAARYEVGGTFGRRKVLLLARGSRATIDERAGARVSVVPVSAAGLRGRPATLRVAPASTPRLGAPPAPRRGRR